MGEIVIFNIDYDIVCNFVEFSIFKIINSCINIFKFIFDGVKLLIGYFIGELVELDLVIGVYKIFVKVNLWLNVLDINFENLVAIVDD